MSLPGKNSKTTCLIPLASQILDNQGDLTDFPSVATLEII